MLRLEDVTPDNWRLGLAVKPEQKESVSDSNKLLARAFAYRNYRSRAFVVYDAETPVGMGLYYDVPELNSYDFSQLFIDCRYQGRGYGRSTMQLVLDEMRRDGKYPNVTLCYIEGNDVARCLYESVGFREIARDGNEIIMEMMIS